MINKTGIFIFAAIGLLLHIETAVSDVHYDTAWTYVYDGGRYVDGKAIDDVFNDIKSLKDGSCIVVGSTADSVYQAKVMLLKIDAEGDTVFRRYYRGSTGNRHKGNTVTVAKNGDYLVGGLRAAAPWVLRIDSSGNTKWATWYYDSLVNRHLLLQGCGVNCVQETSDGQIICAAGDEYADKSRSDLSDYAAVLKFSSTGKFLRRLQWSHIAGYDIGGFYVDETSTGCYLMSGNKALLYIDTSGVLVWEKKYTYMLEGVGSTVNTVNRAKMLRNEQLMVIGQAYESDCWTRYKKLYRDAWWSSISYAYGSDETWNTLGRRGGDDDIYDFTQLADGKIVFVGKKSSVTELGGVWAFVTDSTGENVLWERQVSIPWRNYDGRAPKPLSVCANPDFGFTVAGEYMCHDSNGGMNGFVARFIPSTPSVISRPKVNNKVAVNIPYSIKDHKIIFRTGNTAQKAVKLQIFNASGVMVSQMSREATDAGSITWDCSRLARGVYYYRLNLDNWPLSGRLVLR